ncbi:hypothetical protein KL930_001431 [Ogataea haglerorum]|uniref:Histone-binding protein RBBP4-like N-terminal domain-containing protein n=1 Tax=Ogataea haglerorum TaxID=1937702 RepID=A0AAN6D3Z4_9ASCO|nr:uncharacterized protein KL911_003832 [Ogataea haglerorum]KAG7698653.1 hypothetical protein KL951_001917 [Ogataea haglerorum]KAG7706432.1 hypothetical protein KL914_003327 [Ogataea haglerorum]KAG7724877.1 hypothetical protein KL948_005122 [Ogataea haglerorum]KAG7726362.1 hypothetical protein KL933_003293 [Ogataea haglerorum]KAG7746982.1 hypothetical protein KL912_003594 [Ogataea haglerorum]
MADATFDWSETTQSSPKEVGMSGSDPIGEERRERYFIWKKNAPLLYDYIQTTSLLWPSLTVQWFPDLEDVADTDYQQHRLLLGSHSSGFAKCESLNLFGLKTLRETTKLVDIAADYDPLKNEFIVKRDDWHATKISLVQKIPHRGEINRARYMPQNPDLIATISNNGDLYVFDRTKKPNNYTEDEINESDDFSDIKLEFHQSEGWGLDWNRHKEGELASASSDGTVALWDLTKFKKNTCDKKPAQTTTTGVEFQKRKYKTSTLQPTETAAAHDYGVNCLEYLYFHQNLIGTVGDDKKLKIFDTRVRLNCVKEDKLSDSAINVVSFSQVNEFGCAIGTETGDISLHDLRHMEAPVKTVNKSHNGALTCASWNPENGSLLATGSSDGTVKLWDWSGGPGEELRFVHGGHMLGVNDIDWNLHDANMLVSCSDDNSVQVWKPASTIL